MSKTRDHPALFDGGMMRVGGYADRVAAPASSIRHCRAAAANGSLPHSVPHCDCARLHRPPDAACSVAATLQARRSVPGLGEYVETGVFGEVVISAEYATEAEARAAGYTFDAAAYARDRFGGIEPPAWKVLARDTDFTHKVYCVVEGK